MVEVEETVEVEVVVVVKVVVVEKVVVESEWIHHLNHLVELWKCRQSSELDTVPSHCLPRDRRSSTKENTCARMVI